MSGFFANATNVDARDGVFSDVAGNQYNNTIAGNQTNIYYGPPAQRSERDEQLLATLNPAKGRNSSPEPCMPGTRQSIFKEIDTWAARTDWGVPNIVLLTGSPGAGKSAIASSLASKWREECRLGATFVFRHDNVALNNPEVVWRSVAFDLANHDPTLGEVVIQALKGKTVDPTDSNVNIRLDFECMIKPMKSLEDPKPVFIVLDALDECGWEDSQTMKMRRHMLLDMLLLFNDFPPAFKVVVTSRDEHLPVAFKNVCKCINLHTGQAVTGETNQDIQCFFEKHLLRIPGLVVDQEIIAKLTAKAAGLFIWADTVVKFLDQRKAFPFKLLQLVMNDKFVKDPVYNLYKKILEISFSNADATMLTSVKTILAALALAKVPLDIDDMLYLTEVELSSIQHIIKILSSVISINEEDKCIQISLHF